MLRPVFMTLDNFDFSPLFFHLNKHRLLTLLLAMFQSCHVLIVIYNFIILNETSVHKLMLFPCLAHMTMRTKRKVLKCLDISE